MKIASSRAALLTRLTVVGAVVAGVLVASTGTAQANDRPHIDSVTSVVAQNDSVLGETSGPGIVIRGGGFGNDAPRVTESPWGGVEEGASAVGVQANTRNLHITVDPGAFLPNSYMGLYPNDDTRGDCYVTIGSWSDNEITVLLDGTGLVSCNDLDPDEDVRVEVWSTHDGGGFGISEPSGEFDAGQTRGQGTLPVIDSLSIASGPVEGGTFDGHGTRVADGTITLRGSDFRDASIVWFGDGGLSGARATTSFSVNGDGTELTVRPTEAPSREAKGVFLGVTTPNGTSHLACLTVFGGCAGTYFYESASDLIPRIDTGDINVDRPGTALAFEGSIEQENGSCPAAAPSGPTGASYSASASIEGGPVSFSGTPVTSVNGVLSSARLPLTVTVTNPVTVTLSLSGSVTGCTAFPIPGLSVPEVGGLYMIIGGNITGTYTYTITLNQGSFVVDTGYVPGQITGGSLTSQDCVDTEGLPAPCIATAHAASIAGTLYVTPLFAGVQLEAGPFGVSAGAGFTLAASAQVSTEGGFDHDVCYGGTYSLNANLGPLNYHKTGVFWGPENLYGNGEICGLGSTEADEAPTTTVLDLKDNPAQTGADVVYTATVSSNTGSAPSGSVSFVVDGEPVEDCTEQTLTDVGGYGEATCVQRYGTAGTHQVRAVYAGDETHRSAVSNSRTQEIVGDPIEPDPEPVGTAVRVESSASPGAAREQILLSATVSRAHEAGALTDNGGTVAFAENGVAVTGCTALPLDANGVAHCPRSYQNARTVTVTAHYSGDGDFLASDSQEYLQKVQLRPTVAKLSRTKVSLFGGDTVRINGTNFQLGATVFLRQPATAGHPETDTPLTDVRVVNSRGITAVSPAVDLARPGEIVVSNSGVVSPSAPAAALATFVIASTRPTVTAVSTATGPQSGGTMLTITGTAFTADAQVVIALPATATSPAVLVPLLDATVVDSTHITVVTSPSTAIGRGNVQVFRRTVASVKNTANRFTYVKG